MADALAQVIAMKHNWTGDWSLNHSGDMIEDLLGNSKEMTLNLADAMRQDSYVRFKLTLIVALVLSILSTVCMLFLPLAIAFWMYGAVLGMFVAGLLGILFSMPPIDSVAVHMKVIDYVDNVIKNEDYKRPGLLDDSEEDEEEEVEEDVEEEKQTRTFDEV